MKKTVNAQIVILSLFFFSLYGLNKTFAQGMGIGIATPISVLHVYENTTNVSTTAGLTIEQNSTGDAVVQYLLTGGQRWVTGIDNSDGDKFKISSTADVGSNPRITILTTGEVGIGTVSPDKPLTIQGTGASNELLSFKNSAGTTKWHINQGGSTDLNFVETAVADYRLYLKAGGNVGLGTGSPTSLLNLNGSVPTLTFNHSSGLNQDNTGVIYFSEDATAGFKIRYDGTLSVDKLHFTGRNASTDSDWLTIVRSSGNVGVGTTSPASTLHVNGAARFGLASTTSGSLIFNNSSNTNTLTLQTGTTSSSYTITLPAAQGAANTTLVNNGSGVLSWSAASGGTTRYSIASGATNTFYSDSYIQFRWNTTLDNIQFSPMTGHTGWWDLWQVFEITPDALESGTANSGADDIDAATVGTWYNINSSQTEGEYGPGGVLYITKEDSNSRPVYKIEYILHGTYLTFLVTVYP
jgi:hypothetical protein